MTENNLLSRSTSRLRGIRRSSDDRMIAGVCGGLARSLGVDAAVIRIAFVALGVIGVGSGAAIYVACWLLIPEAEH